MIDYNKRKNSTQYGTIKPIRKAKINGERRKKSKILASLLLVAILFNFIPPLVTRAENPAEIKIINNSGEGKQILVAEGDTFIVDVYFENPTSGVKDLSGSVEFDNSKLELVNKVNSSGTAYEISDIGEGPDVISKSISMVGWDSENKSNQVVFIFHNDAAKGDLKAGLAFQLQFKVKEGATGTFDINLNNIQYVDNANDPNYTNYPITVGSKITGTIKTPLKSISLNKTTTTVGINGTDTLTVTYNPTETTDSKTVTWESSNESVAKVDSNGNVTGIAPGTVTITATSSVTGVKAVKCNVTVTSKLQSISLNKSNVEMAKGQTAQLAVTYNPTNTTDSKKVTWKSSDKSVATVDSNGKVTAVANGQATITATSEVTGITPVTCKINVTTKLQSINLSETKFDMNKGTNKQLTVSYVPADTTDSKTVTWDSSDKSVATVDSNGNIKAIAPGETTITAICNGKMASATISVKSPLTAIEITGGKRELLPSQEATLEVTYTPADTTDSKTVTWNSSDKSVVSVDSKGKVKGLKPGNTTITATCGKITKSINVTVLEVHTERIAFENEKITINKNKTEKAKILYYPENTTDDKTVTWTSLNEKVATVDKNGNIKAIAAGTATIKAQVGTKEATCEVTVKVPLTGITLNTSKVELQKQETEQLTVSYNEEDTTDDKTVTWTSLNEKVATVDKNGKVTAVSRGTAIIQAKVGNYTKTCQVNVKVPLTGISIKDSTKLLKNQSETLIVTYEPVDTTDDRTVTWTSKDTSIATVDKNGKVTGMKEGTTTIVAKVGTFEEECTVEVKEIKLEGIAISNKIDTLLKGQEIDLEVMYVPENTTDDRTVIWSSSDNTILTVDEKGHVIALKEGKATVTAVSGAFETKIEIGVKEIPIMGMEIKLENTTIKQCEKVQLNITFTPENTTDSKVVKYISSDEAILTVDENGVVTAIKEGKAIVTVIAENGVKTQVELTVEPKTVESNNGESNSQVDSPKTSDMNVVLYATLMIVSLLGIVTIIRKRK